MRPAALSILDRLVDSRPHPLHDYRCRRQAHGSAPDSQLPQVCLAGSSFRDPQLVSVLQDAQRLILLDIISRNPHLQLQCADVLASLQRYTRLQDVHIETPGWRAPALHVANATLNLQRALPSVRFRFDGAASHEILAPFIFAQGSIEWDTPG